MKTNYMDMEYWQDLASERKVRLPHSTTGLTTGKMERIIKSCGWTMQDFKEWSGFKNLKQFLLANPNWSARAFMGLILEAQKGVSDSEDNTEYNTD